MNLLVVTHYYPAHGGGIEMVAAELIRRLVARGVRVTWAASRPAGAASMDGLTLLPMRCANFCERRLGIPYPLWSPACVPTLFRAVRDCDAVHLHDSLYMGNLLAYSIARVLRKPVVVTQHVGPVPYSNRVARYLLRGANATLARWLLSGSQRTVFVSEKVRRYFSAKVRFRFDAPHIANGVDTTTFAPLGRHDRKQAREQLGFQDERPVLLFVGRFVEKKGLSIIRTLASKFNWCHWVLAGCGRIDPNVWRLPNVRTIGWMRQEALAPLYRAADLLIHPAVGEGFPLVVQEAMACGTPVLISDDTAAGCPGVEHVAFVAPASANAMAAALETLLAERGVLRRQREPVAEYAAREWNWDACVSRYVEVFEQLGCALPQDGTLWATSEALP